MSDFVATIRRAREPDLPMLIVIERSAGEAFRRLGMPEIADDDPGSIAGLAPFLVDGHLLVAVDSADRPIAYLQLEIVDEAAHIEQVSVHAAHARAGIGRALIDRAGELALEAGLGALTLTTFEDVPWNAPYYERLGFVRIRPDDLTAGLRRIREQERKRGLDRWTRVVMRRVLYAPRPDRVISPGASGRAGSAPDPTE